MQPELASQVDDGLYGAVRALAHRLRLPTTFVKFVIVGGMAFLVSQMALFLLYDAHVLWFLPAKKADADLLLFTHPDILLLISSILAVEAAIVFQFNAHERWTFRWRPRDGLILVRFVKFNLSAIVSPIIMVVTINVLTPVAGLSPYISSVIGVLLGFTWNWVLNTFVIWPNLKAEAEALGHSQEL